MASVGPRMNWYSAPSAWEQVQTWAAKRRAMLDDFDASATAINSALVTVQSNRIAGTANLAAQAALKRIQVATKAKIDTKA